MALRVTPPPLVPASLKSSGSARAGAAGLTPEIEGAVTLGQIGDAMGPRAPAAQAAEAPASGAGAAQQLQPDGKMVLNPQIDQILQVGAETLLRPEQIKQDALVRSKG